MAFHHSQNQFYQQMVDGTGLLMQSPQELQQGYGTANHDQVSTRLYTTVLENLQKSAILGKPQCLLLKVF